MSAADSWLGGLPRTLPADAPADLVTQVLEGRTQGVPEGPNGPVHGLLRLRVAEGVPDRGERLVQLIDRLAERVVHRLALLLGGRAGIVPLLPVVLAEPPAKLGEVFTDVVPCL